MILDFEGVRRLLPQAPPFVFIDRVLAVEPRRSILCLKNVTGGEPFFAGHFPQLAVMPGAIIGEAIAQATILLFRLSEPPERAAQDRLFVIGTTRTRFLHPVFPGDALHIRVEIEKLLAASAMVRGRAEVEGRVVTTSTLTLAALDPSALKPPVPTPAP